MTDTDDLRTEAKRWEYVGHPHWVDVAVRLRWAADELDARAARIDELERWKAEGLAVLDEWEHVYDMVPHPTETLGLTKASVVAARIAELEAQLIRVGVWPEGKPRE